MNYKRYLKSQQVRYEALCRRCGACCGAYDDPCKHLVKRGSATYVCAIYKNRLGLRKTVSGEEFICAPIRDILDTWWPRNHLCPYKKRHKL